MRSLVLRISLVCYLLLTGVVAASGIYTIQVSNDNRFFAVVNIINRTIYCHITNTTYDFYVYPDSFSQWYPNEGHGVSCYTV